MKLADTGATIRLVTVTPAKATTWMEKANGHNRTLSVAYVKRLVAAFNRDEYLFTGDTIKFDTDGYLVDGQHRLAAIAKSGVERKLLVVNGLNPEAIHVIDAESRSRTLGDVLQIEGFKNARGLAGVVKVAWPMEQKGVGQTSGQGRLTMQQALDFIDRRPSLELSTTYGRNLAKAEMNPLTPSEYGAFWDIMSLAHYDVAAEFFDAVAYGYGKKGDNAPIVRRRIQHHVATQQHRSKAYVMTVFIKGWNAEVEGRSLKQIQVRLDEKIPSPIGIDEWRRQGAG